MSRDIRGIISVDDLINVTRIYGVMEVSAVGKFRAGDDSIYKCQAIRQNQHIFSRNYTLTNEVKGYTGFTLCVHLSVRASIDEIVSALYLPKYQCTGFFFYFWYENVAAWEMMCWVQYRLLYLIRYAHIWPDEGFELFFAFPRPSLMLELLNLRHM